MQEEGGRSGAGERGGDLAADDPRLAHARQDDPAAAVEQAGGSPARTGRRCGRRAREIGRALPSRRHLAGRGSTASCLDRLRARRRAGVADRRGSLRRSAFDRARQRWSRAAAAEQRSRRQGVGASLFAGAASSCTSRKTPSTPAATPAAASGSMYCDRPEDMPSPPPGSCRLCVTSKMTGDAQGAQHREGAHVDDEVVVAEAESAFGHDDPIVARRQHLVDGVPHVAGGEELSLLQVDHASRLRRGDDADRSGGRGTPESAARRRRRRPGPPGPPRGCR